MFILYLFYVVTNINQFSDFIKIWSILDETNRKNLIFLILQFLHEEGYEKSLHLYGLPLSLSLSLSFGSFSFTVTVWFQYGNVCSADMLLPLSLFVSVIDWSRIQGFSLIIATSPVLSPMVTGKTQRTTFQHSLVQMLILSQGRCSLTCTSGSFLKHLIGKLKALHFLFFSVQLIKCSLVEGISKKNRFGFPLFCQLMTSISFWVVDFLVIC